ncbi:MAG: hypothetical protein IJV70_04965 [Clostridia bacterium]|nr:hypothetical protein [Clostridia bacterium]
MTGEWKTVEGNYWPDEVSQRDSSHVAITRNVRTKETEEGALLYEYEEAVIDAELFQSIKSAIYATDQEKDIEKIQADVDYIAMMAEIEI